MDILPAIDLLEGKVVRLHQGRYDRVTVYDEDPAARAAAWRGAVPMLHVVDLEGARAGRAVQKDTVRAIARAFGGALQVGGGVRTRETFEEYLALGAARVVLGSAAVADPALVRALAEAHPKTVVVAVDAKDGWVATEGWTQARIAASHRPNLSRARRRVAAEFARELSRARSERPRAGRIELRAAHEVDARSIVVAEPHQHQSALAQP